MVDVGVLPAFVAVMLLFLAPPGPDMAFMVAVGLHRGRRAALSAILGIGTGMCVYVVAVVVGLGEAARAHPTVLGAVQLVGAGYLTWLAVSTLREARRLSSDRCVVGDVGRSGGTYLRGVLVSLTNPKVLLFYLAVLPQFLGDADDVRAQLLVLGLVNVLVEMLLYGAVGVLAGTFHPAVGGSRRARVVAGYLTGVVYVLLAGAVVGEVATR